MSKVYSLITNKIIEQLEQGTVPWRKPWSGGASLGDNKNLISGKPYRGINALLTAMGGYEQPYFLTYKQASQIGGQVRKGEKSTPIVFWKYPDDDKAKAKKENGEWVSPIVRYYAAFNVAQIDGLPESLTKHFQKPKRLNQFQAIDKAEDIINGVKPKPEIRFNQQQAYFSPMLDYINLPKPESFNTPAEYYSTAFHELGHWTGHASRLNRKELTESSYFGSHLYSKEELTAEMTSAFLCGVCDISQPVIDNQAAYIASWLKKLRNDTKLVIQAAQKAQAAADYLQGIKQAAKTKDEKGAA
jgi:antirestriction protein ArdC